MYIGKAADLCNVSTKTIRHYESLGLLPPVQRSGAYRVFTERDIRLIQLIKQVQGLGFRLSEIKAALSANSHRLPWDVVCQLIEKKEEALNQDIKRLTLMSEQLRRHRVDIRQCLAGDAGCDPLL